MHLHPLAHAVSIADWRSRVLLLRSVVLLVACAAGVSAQAAPLLGCYRTSHGHIVCIRALESPDSWRITDYQTGESHQLYHSSTATYQSSEAWSGEAPATLHYRFTTASDCQVTRLSIQRDGAKPISAHRIEARERTAYFQNGDLRLYGKLVLPAAGPAPFPVVVMVQGSDSTPVVQDADFPYLIAANGMGAFVYDKRGSGKSQGQYTQLFPALAGDAVAAVHWLKAQSSEVDTSRIGLAGFSQGGWIAPLAASREPAIKFVLVGYGLAASIAEEDSVGAPAMVRSLGFDSAAVRQFEELNAAIHFTAQRGFKDGWPALEARFAQYSQTGWFAAMKGTPTWSGWLIENGLEKGKVVGPMMFTTFMDAFYDPMPVLQQLTIPSLWLIGGDDLQAPPEPTLSRLTQLRGAGKPITTIVFPHTEHGIRLFTQTSHGRVTRAYAPDYFPTVIQWLRAQTRSR